MKVENFNIVLAVFIVILVTIFSVNTVYPTDEDSVIKIRLSYKIILNPATGERPIIGHATCLVSDEIIEKSVEEMNELLACYWRGYRFEIYEIKEVGSSQNSPANPGIWFHIDFVNDAKRCVRMNKMEQATKNNPTNYAWRENAINIYINQATNGGFWNLGDMIIFGACIADKGWLHLHEICHYFNLFHTQGTDEKNNKNPGDDFIDDTIQDLPCWSRDDIAKYNFSKKYKKLNPEQKKLVDDVAENIMSYHFLEPICAKLTRLTERQLDKWSYFAVVYKSRRKVMDGRTLLVVNNNGHAGPYDYPPFVAINQAIAEANNNGGDIILLRPGVYNEQVTIDKPLTLRVTRKGAASIGTSIENKPTLASNGFY